jgi:hypothetical protein
MRHSAGLLSATLATITGLVLMSAVFASYSKQEAQYNQLAVPNVQVDPDETATVTPIASPTPLGVPPFADCGWVTEAQAFVDANGNGKRDRGERPLAGVAFHVDDVVNHIQDVGEDEAISDSSGSAELFVRLLCSGDSELEIYAVPPAGYISTTPQRLSEDELLLFGFRRSNTLPGMPGTGHP